MTNRQTERYAGRDKETRAERDNSTDRQAGIKAVKQRDRQTH